MDVETQPDDSRVRASDLKRGVDVVGVRQRTVAQDAV